MVAEGMTDWVSKTKALLVGTGFDGRASPVLVVVAATSSLSGSGASLPFSLGEAGVCKASGLTGGVGMGSAEEEAAAAASGVVAGRSSSWSGVPLAADEGAAADEAAACAGAAAEDEAAFAAAGMAGRLRVTPNLLQRPWAKVRVARQRRMSIRGFINSAPNVERFTLLIRNTTRLLHGGAEFGDE